MRERGYVSCVLHGGSALALDPECHYCSEFVPVSFHDARLTINRYAAETKHYKEKAEKAEKAAQAYAALFSLAVAAMMFVAALSLRKP